MHGLQGYHAHFARAALASLLRMVTVIGTTADLEQYAHIDKKYLCNAGLRANW